MMMTDRNVKVCPDCQDDYLPHVENCADCGTPLVSFEENALKQEDKKRCLETTLEEPVPIREGPVPWIDELHHMLIDSGIPCRIHADSACAGGCKGNTVELIVSSNDAERAHLRIEEYFAEAHPEARALHEMVGEGKCPACGTDVEPSAAECPDCGLNLITIL
jgi:hypothetical protein